MAVVTPFRITPNLGPDLTQTGREYYWDTIRPEGADPTYQLGVKVIGSDGHEYVHVLAGANLSADARVNIDEATWTATAAGSGSHQVVSDVLEGEAFHARKYAL